MNASGQHHTFARNQEYLHLTIVLMDYWGQVLQKISRSRHFKTISSRSAIGDYG